MTSEQDPRLDTEFQSEKKAYSTYTDLIQKDPEQTYVGGTFKDEIHTIHDIEIEGRVITGFMDVNNKYAGSSRFHLTQMGAYSFLAQLILGYMCYKHGITKDDLGMPTLREFNIRWKKMIRSSTKIRARVEERNCTIEKGRHTIEWGFDIGDGSAFGHIIGVLRFRKNEDKK